MRSPARVEVLRTLSDRELLAETHRLAERERHATAHVIAALMEVDGRKLYLGQGCSSLFTYCTLHFSEHAAYGRIEAARTARRVPEILDQLADGSLTLTTVGLLASHLTPENHTGLLAAAGHKPKREVEHLIAALRPLPAVPSSVRKLPAGRPTIAAPTPFASRRPPEAPRAVTPVPASAEPGSGALLPGSALPGFLTSRRASRETRGRGGAGPRAIQSASHHLARGP
jgi:hypothetical protein